MEIPGLIHWEGESVENCQCCMMQTLRNRIVGFISLMQGTLEDKNGFKQNIKLQVNLI